MSDYNWREITGTWVLLPDDEPVGIVHFIGGAFLAAAPHIVYRWLLERFGDRGYLVVATPILNGSFDHARLAGQALDRFETVLDSLDRRGWLDVSDLPPVYGLGHSLGCKLQILIGSLYRVERAGNILISFNNFSAQRAIPLFDRLTPALTSVDRSARQWIDNLSQSLGNLVEDLSAGRFDRDRAVPRLSDLLPNPEAEFSPSPSETESLIAQQYTIEQNLLIKFSDDSLDQSLRLGQLLSDRFPDGMTLHRLPGNHLTPLGQEIRWQVGQDFSPLDAFGQWVSQDVLYRDLNRLDRQIQTWLDA